MTGPEIRAVARLARRTARREWKRTTLITLLVALPVAAAVVVAGIGNANRVSPQEQAADQLGAADLRVDVWPSDDAALAWFADAVSRLALDAEVLAEQRVWGRLFEAGRSELTDLDLTSPLAEGRLGLVEGRVLEDDDEILLTPALASHLDVSLGGTVVLADGTTVEVVGLVRDALSLRRSFGLVAPERLDMLLASLAGGDGSMDEVATTLFVSSGMDDSSLADRLQSAWDDERFRFAPTPAVAVRPPELEDIADDVWVQLSSDQVEQLLSYVRDGGRQVHDFAFSLVADDFVPIPTLQVQTRSAITEVAQYEETLQKPTVLGGLLAAALLAEVALLAGAAYTTGARRRLREIGLLGATGASERHVRGAVLGEALVAAVIGSAVGIGVGVAMLTAGRAVLQRFVDKLITGVPLNPADVIVPSLFAVIALLVAAWLPARTAAGVPTTVALQGRMPLSPSPRRLPAIGVGLSLFGALLFFVSATSTGGGSASLLGAVGVLAMIGGAALLTGPLVAALGGRADRLGATSRLVVRDAARQRTRAASAMAAMMVILLLPVLLATSMATDTTHRRVYGLHGANHLVLLHPPGNVLIADGETGDAGAPSLATVAAARDILPDAQVVDVSLLDVDLRGTGDDSSRPLALLIEDGAPEPMVDQRTIISAMVATDGLAAAFLDGRVEAAVGRGEIVLLGVDDRATDLLLGGERFTATEVAVPTLAEGLPRLLVPPEIVAANGWDLAGSTVLLANPVSVTQDQLEALWELEIPLAVGWLTVDNRLVAWGGVGAALVLVLLVTALVTALTATEADHDLRTMVAVGAPPSMRRRFLGLQTAMTTLLAAGLAIPLGLLLFWTGTSANGFASEGPFGTVGATHVSIPWAHVAVLLAALPVVVGMATALVVRSSPTTPPVVQG